MATIKALGKEPMQEAGSSNSTSESSQQSEIPLQTASHNTKQEMTPPRQKSVCREMTPHNLAHFDVDRHICLILMVNRVWILF